jgi:hypothetical protein
MPDPAAACTPITVLGAMHAVRGVPACPEMEEGEG